MNKNAIYPKFTRQLLHPRYLLTWFGFAVLYLLVQLPYRWLFPFGKWLGRRARPFMKRRVTIAQRNIERCFPELSLPQQQQLLLENMESTGMALIETGMAWFWSDKRLKKHLTVKGLENISAIQAKQQGILLLGIHFLTLELGARLFGLYNPGIGVYRPNDNPVIDYLQIWGRSRSNKYLVDRYNIKGMIRELRSGEILWYAPDHDYGRENSVFAPFFAVKQAASTIGTSILMRHAKPAIIPFRPIRHADGSGYSLIIDKAVADFPVDDLQTAATFINQVIEQQIQYAPAQYMWLHRRFKTRPAGEDEFY